MSRLAGHSAAPAPGHGSPAHSPKPPVTRERLEGEANQVARRVAFGPAASSTLTPTEIRARLPSTRSGRAMTGDSTAASIRRELGESLGFDFSGVRLHADADAADIAARERAHAVTQGADVFFGDGRFRPDIALGRGLIAHELAHVAQTGNAPAIGGRDHAAFADHEAIHGEQLSVDPAWSRTRLKLDSCDGCGGSCKSGTGPTSGDGATTTGDAGTAAGDAGTAAGDAGTAAPVVAPSTLPAKYASYYADIDSAVKALNERLKPPTPLDPDWIRAMMEVESPAGDKNAADARKYDPLQFANAGDQAFGVLQGGKEHSELIDPDIKAKLAKKKQTPRAGGKWDYSKLSDAERMDAATSILAGVAYVFVKAANFSEKNVESGPEQSYTVEAGDTLDKIATKKGTTVDTLKKRNPGINPKLLKPGKTELKFVTAHKEWQITKWSSWETAITAYNGGGDPKYFEKVKKNYDEIKAATKPKVP